MSSSTEKLGLFMYDPSDAEDANQAFNIQKALNENWKKIDDNAVSVTLKVWTAADIGE